MRIVKGMAWLGLAVALASPAVGQQMTPRVLENEEGLSKTEHLMLRAARAAGGAEVSKAPSLCHSTGSALCLLGRFGVGASWQNPFDGSGGLAGAVQLTSSSGYMWWLSPLVMEVPMKLLDFCGAAPPSFKFFAAGLTDFAVEIVVVDFATGRQVLYTNPGGHVFNTIIDQAPPFPCP